MTPSEIRPRVKTKLDILSHKEYRRQSTLHIWFVWLLVSINRLRFQNNQARYPNSQLFRYKRTEHNRDFDTELDSRHTEWNTSCYPSLKCSLTETYRTVREEVCRGPLAAEISEGEEVIHQVSLSVTILNTIVRLE